MVTEYAAQIEALERVRTGLWWLSSALFGAVLLLLGVGTLAVAPSDPTALGVLFAACVVGTAVFVAVAIIDV